MNGSDDHCKELQDELDRIVAELAVLNKKVKRLGLLPDEKADILAQISELWQQFATVNQALYQCGFTPAKPTSNLSVYDIEQTQAIQYFNLTLQGSHYAPDNSVPLVAKKDLILRVYIEKSNVPGLPVPTNLTGKVSYKLPGDLWPTDLSPINAPIVARDWRSVDRGNPDHTLNFRMPAADCAGIVYFTVTVWDPDQPGTTSSSSKSFTANFRDVGAVKYFAFLVNYIGKDANGNSVNIPNPLITKLINILQWVKKVYPITGFYLSGCTVIEYNDDAPIKTNTCGAPWDDLAFQLATLSFASTEKAVYLGVFPVGVPGGGATGCGGVYFYPDGRYAGYAIGFENDDGTTFAQEIGHSFRGGSHAPCGNPPNPDASYPYYQSYPRASIGEYGFDTVTSQVFNPANTYDFMSYCAPKWVSPYTYINLMNSIVGSQYQRLLRQRVVPSKREHLLLVFCLDRDNKVELLPSLHLPISEPERGISPPSPITCDLLDDEGRIIESGPCHLPQPQRNPYAPDHVFHAILPWNASIQSIAFRRDGELIQTVELEKNPPALRIKGYKFAEKGKDLVRVEWEAKYPHASWEEEYSHTSWEGESHHSSKAEVHKPIQYMVRYSHDNGETWRALSTNLTEPHYLANLELLPGGEQCVFQIVAYAGVRTAVATTEPFSVSQKPYKAYILSPESGTTVKKGEAVVLLGGGFSPDFQTTEFEDGVWTSSLDGVIGTGYEVVTHNLSVGRHKITLNFPDGLGGEAIASVFVYINDISSN
jgi:hypothetical protein